MGAIGARIYEDDIALDLRGDFRDYYYASTPVTEIEDTLLDDYLNDDDRYDDVVWLALCCAELETGTLTDRVKTKALEVIASGRQYALWLEEAGKTEAGARSHELTLIRKYIECYDGKPVKRKSWVELQKADTDSEFFEEETDELKLDDADWHSFDPDEKIDDETFYAYAGAHIACFVYWLISRGYFNARDAGIAKAMDAVKEGQLDPSDFLATQMDHKLFSTDAAEAVRSFVTAYYQGGVAASYPEDYERTVLNVRGIYTFRPEKPDYEKMAACIDERYEQYKVHPYQAATAPGGMGGFGLFREVLRRLPLSFWLWSLLAIVCFAVYFWLSYHNATEALRSIRQAK